MYIERLKEMFENVIVKKNASAIPKYYNKDFLLHTNGQEMSYEEFVKLNLEINKIPIQYEIQYDEETLVEIENKIAGRIWVTISKHNKPSKIIEVIMIIEYIDDKIHTLWELTFPDWTKLPEFRIVNDSNLLT